MRNIRFIFTILLIAIIFEGCMIFNTKGFDTRESENNALTPIDYNKLIKAKKKVLRRPKLRQALRRRLSKTRLKSDNRIENPEYLVKAQIPQKHNFVEIKDVRQEQNQNLEKILMNFQEQEAKEKLFDRDEKIQENLRKRVVRSVKTEEEYQKMKVKFKKNPDKIKENHLKNQENFHKETPLKTEEHLIKMEKILKEEKENIIENPIKVPENHEKVLENFYKKLENEKPVKTNDNHEKSQVNLKKLENEKPAKINENLETIQIDENDKFERKKKVFEEQDKKESANNLPENLLKKFEINNMALPQKNLEESQQIKYKQTIESLQSRPLPQWYDEAKIGIFIHWGVYSVPAIGSEWFWYSWKAKRHPLLENYMQKTQKPGFTYQHFARDFTAEFYNPNDWISLFKEAGAKYVVLTSKHHDGYTLWPSQYSSGWNSVDVGPNRDLVGEFVAAVKKKSSMKLGLYYSLYEWFDRLFLKDAANNFQTQNFVKMKTIPQIKELIELYQPELLWVDGDWNASKTYWDSEKLLAWLYNEAPNHETIVTNDRWGRGARKILGDFHSGRDRFNPGKIQEHKFENCFTIDKHSWGYRENAKLEDYLTVEELIREVVTTVSCNGNVLINVGPSKNGMIHPIFVDRLRPLGRWLKKNGEGIYGSKPWIHEKENENIWYTSKQENDRTFIYVFVLEYPYDTNEIVLEKLAMFVDQKTEVILLGLNKRMKTKLTDDSLTIIFPEKKRLDRLFIQYAWTFKVDIPIK